MYLFISFDGGLSREIAVSTSTVISVKDVDLADSFVLDGVKALYLTTDSGGGANLGDTTGDEIARSVGWSSPGELAEEQKESARLRSQLEIAEKAIAELQKSAKKKSWRG